MTDLVHSQSELVYYCFTDQPVEKPGWYVAVRLENTPWRVKWGPCNTEAFARKVRTEVHNDVGHPQRLAYRVVKLSKNKQAIL